MENESGSCSIRDACERVVPLWLVLLDNLPTAVLFLLGAALTGMVWRPLGAAMLVYNLLSIVLFWKLICRHCRHLGTRSCPCGYGVLAARYFKGIPGSDFRKIFRKNIAIMYPCWFIPFAAGVTLLLTRYSHGIVLLFAAFVVVGFIVIPFISRFAGCKGCSLKSECPWMSSGRAAADV